MSSNSGAVKCDNCEAVLRKLPLRSEPKGVTFVLEDHTHITLCRTCLIDLGSGKFEPKSDYMKSIWKKEEDNE